MTRALIVEIFGNAKQFQAELAKAEGKTKAFGKVAGVAGVALAGGLAYGLEKSVKAAEGAQEATARLNEAFKASGLSAATFTEGIDKAEASGRKLGFTNEETKNALGSLVVATHDGKKALADLGVAADIARFKHVDLTQATKMLTMAQTGSQRALKQLGLTVQPVTDAQDKLKVSYQQQTDTIKAHYAAIVKTNPAMKEAEDAALGVAKANYIADKAYAKMTDTSATADAVVQQVSSHLHGQAQAFSDTAAGGAAQFHAQIESLQVSLGTVLLPIITQVSQALAGMAEFLAKHTTLAKVLVGVLGGLAAILIGISVATKAWAVAQGALNLVMEANPIVLVTTVIIALGVALVEVYKHSETFREIVNAAFNAVKNVAFDLRDAFIAVKNWVADNWPIIATLISGPFAPLVALATNAFGIRDKLTDAFTAIKTFVASNWPEIATIISGPFAPLVALATGAFGVRETLTKAFTAIKNEMNGLVNDIVGFWTAMPGEVAKAIGAGAKSVEDAIIGIFDPLPSVIKDLLGISSPSTVFAEIGQNVVHGFIKGIESMGPALRDKATGLFGSIGHAVGTIGGDIAGAVTGGFNGVKELGKLMAASYGWTGGQWAALEALWDQESGWNPRAENPSSGAYGIPQALPPTKMPYAAQAGGGSSAQAQIAWGLAYIKSRYGNPANAWDGYWQRGGWYAKGGIFSQPTIIGVGEAGPEAVVPLSGMGRLGGTHVTVNLPNYLGNAQDVAYAIRAELVKIGRREGNVLGGFA